MMIKTIGVCGAGTMGHGIAQVAARAGLKTILYDVNADVLSTAKQHIDKSLAHLVEKTKITSREKDQTLELLHFTVDINQCQADLVIEAIVEKENIKIELFNKLAEINTPETILASNTSSLSIQSIAEKIKNPERVTGLHFFNPAPVMKLVEVVTTEFTASKVLDAVVELTKQMNKVPVVCRDSPGFIVNRVARPFYIESLRLVENGITDFETMDKLMEATGFRMGPFKLMDLIGNDVNYAVSCSVYNQLNRPERLRPSPIQEEKVKTGSLGRKTGKGYYQYE